MKWERGHESADVVDQRRKKVGAGTIASGGAILVALLALVSQVLGVDITGLAGGGGGGGSASGTTAESTGAASGSDYAVPKNEDADRELKEFVSFVIDDIQQTFSAQCKAQGKSAYQNAKLVLFTDAVDTGCGRSSSAIGPFYCPPDQRAYIDLSFYRVLKDRLSAGGDFAQAYVLAHELGHHLQNLFGTDLKVRQQVERDPARENELSVRQELQADCYAGVWAHFTDQKGLVEKGDIEESVNAAAQIGDDRLAKMAGQEVNPETFTHGSSAQRVKWFKSGYSTGKFDACDTFAAAQP